eukprot:SM000033S12317  [mRNA]  locus=s33:90752:94674:+ [translate_table: standard]
MSAFSSCWFPPTCLSLTVVGLVKGLLIFPLALVILVVGNTLVALGLLPLTFVMTLYSVALTKQLSMVQRAGALVCLPVLILLWPVVVFVGSLFVSVMYGFFVPQIATFKAIGDNREDKLHHVLRDGFVGQIGVCVSIVEDFADFSYNSYPWYLKNYRTKEVKADSISSMIKIKVLPGCLLVSVCGLLADTVLLTAIAIAKSPVLLWRGWQRLFESAIERQGLCLEATCLPCALLVLLLWPIAVLLSIIGAFMLSPFVGLYAAAIAYQENSTKMGFAYIMTVVAEFDEYTNELLDMNEGTVFPKYGYRQDAGSASQSSSEATSEQGAKVAATEEQDKAAEQSVSHQSLELPQQQLGQVPVAMPLDGDQSRASIWQAIEKQAAGGGMPGRLPQRQRSPSLSSRLSGLERQRSGPAVILHRLARTAAGKPRPAQHLAVKQLWSSLMGTCKMIGHELVDCGVIGPKEMQRWTLDWAGPNMRSGAVGIPALCLLRTLLQSYKRNSAGLVFCDGHELLASNKPDHRVVEWFFNPLMVIKLQLQADQLSPREERYFEGLVLSMGNDTVLERWLQDKDAAPPTEAARNSELQGFARRIQGIATTLATFPTFRRRFHRLVEELGPYARAQRLHQPTSVPASIDNLPV